MTAQSISVWIAIVSALAAGVARFSALEESRTIQQSIAADHSQRLKTLELDRSSLEREHTIELSINELKFKIEQLRQELHEGKRSR